MKSFIYMLLLLMVLDVNAKPLSQEQQKVIVDKHNKARSSVEPTPANMRKMEWNNELAASAEKYAQECKDGHSKGIKFQGKTVGENIFSTTNETTPELSTVLDGWMSGPEKDGYNFEKNQCNGSEPFKKCGHYTAVIWATTNKVGCGLVPCGKKQYLVCHYAPAGNVMDKKPYEAGESCSKCPAGSQCGGNDKLCTCVGDKCDQGSRQNASNVSSVSPPALNASNSTDKNALKDNAKNMSNFTSKNAANCMGKNGSNCMRQNAPAISMGVNASNSTGLITGKNDVLNPMRKNMLNPTVQNASNPMVENVANPTAKNVPNPIIQNALNPMVQNALNPMVQNALNPTVQNVINPTVQNAFNTTGKNVFNPMAQNVFNTTGKNVFNLTGQNPVGKNNMSMPTGQNVVNVFNLTVNNIVNPESQNMPNSTGDNTFNSTAILSQAPLNTTDASKVILPVRIPSLSIIFGGI